MDYKDHKSFYPSGRFCGPICTSFNRPGEVVSSPLCKRSNESDCKTFDYKINSLGFRGPEFDTEAEFRLVIGGDSNTFGLGLEWEETWGAHLLRLLEHSTDFNSYALLNTASPGAPNDYISRTLIDCAETYSASLAIGVYTFPDRKEHITDERVLHLGPWQETEKALRYYDYYTRLDGFANTMKNMLLFQMFCETAQIPYLICWINEWMLKKGHLANHPLTAFYVSLLKSDNFCNCPLVQGDTAYDERHCGPESNRTQAIRFHEFIGQRYPEIFRPYESSRLKKLERANS